MSEPLGASPPPVLTSGRGTVARKRWRRPGARARLGGRQWALAGAVESWDGSKTSVVPPHYDLGYLAGLAAVSCVPAGPCVAVGSTGQGAPGARSLIEMS
jgi:hypothetical protein